MYKVKEYSSLSELMLERLPSLKQVVKLVQPSGYIAGFSLAFPKGTSLHGPNPYYYAILSEAPFSGDDVWKLTHSFPWGEKFLRHYNGTIVQWICPIPHVSSLEKLQVTAEDTILSVNFDRSTDAVRYDQFTIGLQTVQPLEHISQLARLLGKDYILLILQNYLQHEIDISTEDITKVADEICKGLAISPNEFGIGGLSRSDISWHRECKNIMINTPLLEL